MRRLSVATMIALACLCVGSLAPAQQPPQPGPEHQILKDMEGTWEAKIEGVEGPAGKIVYKMAVGGLWQISDYEGSFDGFQFSGHGLNGYDPVKQKYVSVWVDSMSPGPMTLEGDYDAETKKLTMTGEAASPSGETVKMTSITEIKDKNTMHFTLQGPMGEMTIVYTRK